MLPLDTAIFHREIPFLAKELKQLPEQIPLSTKVILIADAIREPRPDGNERITVTFRRLDKALALRAGIFYA